MYLFTLFCLLLILFHKLEWFAAAFNGIVQYLCVCKVQIRFEFIILVEGLKFTSDIFLRQSNREGERGTTKWSGL